jgi:hypothetical protein
LSFIIHKPQNGVRSISGLINLISSILKTKADQDKDD